MKLGANEVLYVRCRCGKQGNIFFRRLLIIQLWHDLIMNSHSCIILIAAIIYVKAFIAPWDYIIHPLTVRAWFQCNALNIKCQFTFQKVDAVKAQTDEVKGGQVWSVGRMHQHFPPTAFQPLTYTCSNVRSDGLLILISQLFESNKSANRIPHWTMSWMSLSFWWWAAAAHLIAILRNTTCGFSHVNVPCQIKLLALYRCVTLLLGLLHIFVGICYN